MSGGPGDPRKHGWDTGVVSACFVVVWILLGSLMVGSQRDFTNLYRGASLAMEGRFVENSHIPGATKIIYVRPPSYALILAPLALLGPQKALWVWIGIQTLILSGCILWAWRRFGGEALLFGAMFAPAALSIPSGQDAPLILAILIAAYVLAERERASAGAVLGLGFIKFNLFLLWPLLLLITRRFRVLAWMGISVAAQLALSVSLCGVSGLRQYAALLRRDDLVTVAVSLEKMPAIPGILLNFGVDSRAVYLACAGLVVILASWAALRASLWRFFALATAGSLLIVPHVYAYDGTMLLLPAWCAMSMSGSRFTRTAAAVFCTPVVFLVGLFGPPWSAALGLSLCVFFASCLQPGADQALLSSVAAAHCAKSVESGRRVER